MFACCIAVLPVTTAMLPIVSLVLLSLQYRLVVFVIMLQYIRIYSPINSLFHPYFTVCLILCKPVYQAVVYWDSLKVFLMQLVGSYNQHYCACLLTRSSLYLIFHCDHRLITTHLILRKSVLQYERCTSGVALSHVNCITVIDNRTKFVCFRL